jgi:hypothetical protein
MALAGSFLSLFYMFHYMQVLSESLGAYYEAETLVNAYNLTASSGMLALLSGSSSIRLALYLTYVLLPFSLVMFVIGILWFFTKAYSKLTGAVMSITAVIYLLIMAVLENNFVFHSTWLGLAVVCAGGLLVLLSGAHALGLFSGAAGPGKAETRRRSVQIGIDPATPYSNMMMLSSKLMGRLSGEIKILDMHFDVTALDNLARLMGKNTGRYSKISVLSKRERLGEDFAASYRDFKEEMLASHIEFELRVMAEEDSSKQHERLLLDGSEAYKIPPLNIINRKSEHITAVNLAEAARRFDDLWSRAMKYDNMGIGVGYKSADRQ